MSLNATLARALEDGRRWTHRLLDVLDDDAVHAQPDEIMSPLVWDLGHVGNYEELWLLRRLGDPGFADARMDRVYDAFENPRWTRADLPLLPRAEAREYLADVRAAVLRRLRASDLDPADPLLSGGLVYSLVVQHEAQHQETMLQALDLGTIAPYPLAAQRWVPLARPVDDEERVLVPGGPCTVGTDDAAATYDNERPLQVVHVPTFALDRYPVTARRYAAFMAAGGYERAELWSERGWTWRLETGCDAPQGWLRRRDGWQVRRLGHVVPLDPAEPVEHVTFFEAEAFARWAGGRLPTEHEWEKAAGWDPVAGRARRYPWGDGEPSPLHANLNRRSWGPAPVGSYPAGASAYGVEQLVGDGYEWTASDFLPYPGYRTFPYAEYSEVFFGGDYKVLRGASWASRSCVARATFRNWDHPYRRQIFAGIRLAWDV
jgi:gamma-glutamyl hercynylcysteine S-oxide synthase